MPFLPSYVLSFAATDPTGGAGLQADLLTLASLRCHPLSVVTAITVQDTHGVAGLLPVGANWVADQARTVLAEIPVAAFKLGALASVENAQVIARILGEHPGIPVVFDPVVASARGDPLGTGDLLEALRELIVPLATIATPNSIEARRLASGGRDPAEVPLHECAQHLLELGCRYVLLTGTHESTPDVVNTLYSLTQAPRIRRWPRLPGSYHGSGCTLASAIAAHLAKGARVPAAVDKAQEFTWQALAGAYRPGTGQHLPDRFFQVRATADGAR